MGVDAFDDVYWLYSVATPWESENGSISVCALAAASRLPRVPYLRMDEVD